MDNTGPANALVLATDEEREFWKAVCIAAAQRSDVWPMNVWPMIADAAVFELRKRTRGSLECPYLTTGGNEHPLISPEAP